MMIPGLISGNGGYLERPAPVEVVHCPGIMRALSGSTESLRHRNPWAALRSAHGYFRIAFQAEDNGLGGAGARPFPLGVPEWRGALQAEGLL